MILTIVLAQWHNDMNKLKFIKNCKDLYLECYCSLGKCYFCNIGFLARIYDEDKI